MKKVFLLLVVAGLSFSAVAQEDIPLFFDTERPTGPQSETPAEGAARAAVEESVPVRKVGQPRLGRDAKPLDSLVIVPLPNNEEVSIQLNDKKTPGPTPVIRRPARKADVITRSNPVSMTEAGDLSDAYLEALLSGTIRENPAARVPGGRYTAFGERYDARAFSIAGLMLGMTAEEIIDVADENGYALKITKYGIPAQFQSYYEAKCRATPMYITSEIKECVTNMAKDVNMYHPTMLEFVKPANRESITVWLSSYATDNAAYKIQYVAKGDNSLNFSRANVAKKNARKDHFWRQVFQTYGMPDDGENLIWGDWYTAYLHAKMTGSAYDAYLVLEDRTVPGDDNIAMINEAGEIPNPSPFTFSEDEGDY